MRSQIYFHQRDVLEMSLVEDEWEYEYDNDDVEVGAMIELEAENTSLTIL